MIFSLTLLFFGCHPRVIPPVVHQSAMQSHRVTTADDAEVVLLRRETGGAPVLIVHGISSNHNCWDLNPERSLAVYLEENGFEPWLLDLRGHGDASVFVDGRKQRAGWPLDAYGLYDVPAAVQYIQEITGVDEVAYVGHSMGGMVGAIYASAYPGGDESLSVLVNVAGPVDFRDPEVLLGFALRVGRHWLPPKAIVPTPRLAHLYLRLGEIPLVDAMLFTDIGEPERTIMYERVVSPISSGEIRQMSRAGEKGEFVSWSGEESYLSGLGQVQTPTMVIAGRADRIAPVDRVLPYCDAVGGEALCIVAGRSTGFAVDYGHLDLTSGDHVREEIYPLILEWLVQ